MTILVTTPMQANFLSPTSTLMLQWLLYRLRACLTKHHAWCSEGMEENPRASRSPFMIDGSAQAYVMYSQVAMDKA